MMRRVAVVLGVAWTFLLAWTLFSEIAADIRQQAWPYWSDLKLLGVSVLIQGSMAFLCFAVAVALGQVRRPNESPTDAGGSEES